MNVSNLSVAALFDSLMHNQFDRRLLLDGTHLKLDYVMNVKNKLSWYDFVKMYENIARLLGPEKAAREIAHHGLYTEKMSTIRKYGSGMLDAKLIYWGISTFLSKHLFNECVTFNYTKIKSNHLKMEIVIDSDLDDCPLLLETYKYLFENVPTVLGLSKAFVTATISEKKAEYNIYLEHTSFFNYLFCKMFKVSDKITSSLALMSELQNRSMELSKAIEEKSELLRIISHDISNISTVVDMSLSRVIKSDNLNENDKATLEKAVKASDRLRLILRNVQKLEVANLRGITLEPVDVKDAFLKIQDYYQDQLLLKNLNLVIHNELPFGITALAEKNSLESNVLSNLLSNAIKFSPSGAQISLETYLENNQVVIAIYDNGKGINDENKKHLFSKRMRQSMTGTNGEVGTGFGLGIVNTYVQLYGGKISVQDNYPSGTIFKIFLASHSVALGKHQSFNEDFFYNSMTDGEGLRS